MTFLPPHAILGDPEAPRCAFLLHGILGSKQNWRVFARRLAQQLPDWRFVTVDHRNHGDATPTAGPHTLAACADDLARLAAHIGAPEVVSGHSFGGKVALAYAKQKPAGLEQVWVLDATPGDHPEVLAGAPNEVLAVMAALKEIPQPLQRRDEVVGYLRMQGFDHGIARWMTTNLRRGEGGYVWRFNLDAAREMIDDYFRQDLWAVVEAPQVSPELHVVRAERSDRWTPDLVARLESPPAGAPVSLHLLENAGHWVHADNPEGLLELMVDWWLP